MKENEPLGAHLGHPVPRAVLWLCPPGSPWLRPGSAALGKARTQKAQWLYKLLHIAHTETPRGRSQTPFFPWKKPSGLLTRVVASSRKRGAGAASPLPPHPSLCRSHSALSRHLIPQKKKQRVGLPGKAWRSCARWLPGSLRNGLFLASHLAACARLPNPPQPLACLPRGAAQHGLLTV